MPHVFTKVMKTQAKLNGKAFGQDQLLDILTVNLFPLISQLLMLSDEQVQLEGVKALVTVAKSNIIEPESLQFLIGNVLNILYKKSQEVENAKVGALLLLEAFVKEEVFGKDKCDEFVREQLQHFLAQKLYKIKRPLMQCLVTISKHLDHDTILKQVFPIYKQFSHLQEVWGLRRLCIQTASEMVEQLGSEDVEALKYVLSFLQTSLQRPPATLPADQISSEGWVRA